MVPLPRSVPLPLALQLLRSGIDCHYPKLWLGQLPDGLPIALPLPEHSQITASLQQAQTCFTVLLQLPQPPLLIQSWYCNRLRDLGWLQWCSEADPADFNLFLRTSRLRHTPRLASPSATIHSHSPSLCRPALWPSRLLSLNLRSLTIRPFTLLVKQSGSARRANASYATKILSK